MPDAVDRPDEGGVVPELWLADGVEAPEPEVERPEGASAGDTGLVLVGDNGDEGLGELVGQGRDEEGYEPSGDGPDYLDLFDQAEAGDAEPPSREQVVGRARDVLVEEGAVDDGDTSKALTADARKAVREYAVKVRRSVDKTDVFREAAKVTDADVEAVVKALRDAVQKVGLEGVLAIVAELAGDRETLKTLLLITETSSAPTRVKDLARRFSSRGLLFTGAALMCAAGINVALLGDAIAETALTNETAIGALLAAVAALIKQSR